MLRTHDVVLFDGTFRVVLTPKRRVIAVLDAPETLLGPIHVALEIDRGAHLPAHVSPSVLLEPSHVTAGIFDDIGHAIGKAAEGTFNATSKVATTLARPAFDVLKHAAGEGAHLVSQVTPFLPAATRHQLAQAAHVIMRARLGDLTAKQFLRTIGTAAKAGVKAAQQVGDTLLDASKLVTKAVDVPGILASQVPGLRNVTQFLSPFQRYEHMVSALQKGDFKALKHMAEQDLSLAQGVVSLVPGVGTGVSAAIGAGLAALEGGSPLEIAIRTAYGAIPIPIGVRQATDSVLEAVLALAAHPHELSDVAVKVAREKVPAGLPRDVFDTLVQLVAKRMPIQRAAASAVEHYVQKYAPAVADHHMADVLRELHVDPSHAKQAAEAAAGRLLQPLAALHA